MTPLPRVSAARVADEEAAALRGAEGGPVASPRVAVGHPGRSAAVQEESGKGGPGVPEPDLVWKRHRIVSPRRRRPRKALPGDGWEGRRARQAPRPGPSAPAWASAGIGVAHTEAFPEGHTEAPPARFVSRGVRPGSHSGQRYVTAEAGTPPPAKTTAGAALAWAWRPAWEEGVPGGTRQEGAPWAPPRCTGHRGVRLRPRPCSERRPPRRAAVFADPSRGPQHGRATATVRGARASCGAGAATAQGPRGRAAASSRARGAAQAPVLSDSRAGRRRDSATHGQAATRAVPGLRPGSAGWHRAGHLRLGPSAPRGETRPRRSGDPGTPVSAPIRTGDAGLLPEIAVPAAPTLSLSLLRRRGTVSAPVGSRAMSPRCAPDPAGCVTMTGSMVATVTFRGQLQRAKGGGCLALSCPLTAAVTRAASFLQEL